MTDQTPVQLSLETIEAYFADIVDKAVEYRRVSITEPAQFYIVTLLSQFATSDRLYRRDEENGRLEREALALLLARASSAPVQERVRLLKRLGDSSLYISGFFAESLARSLVDVDYYISMGGSAYGSLSDLYRARPGTDSFSLLFAELADNFRELVEVVSRVSSQANPFCASNESLLRLYDIWVRTRSPRLAEKLRANGLEPAAAVKEPGGEQ
jgi:hypothetical protein